MLTEAYMYAPFIAMPWSRLKPKPVKPAAPISLAGHPLLINSSKINKFITRNIRRTRKRSPRHAHRRNLFI